MGSSVRRWNDIDKWDFIYNFYWLSGFQRFNIFKSLQNEHAFLFRLLNLLWQIFIFNHIAIITIIAINVIETFINFSVPWFSSGNWSKKMSWICAFSISVNIYFLLFYFWVRHRVFKVQEKLINLLLYLSVICKFVIRIYRKLIQEVLSLDSFTETQTFGIKLKFNAFFSEIVS